MMLTDRVAAGVADGSIVVAYRRWGGLRVREGSTFRTTAGVVGIREITIVDPNDITEADARAAGADSRAALLASLRGAPSDPVYRIGLHWVGEDPRQALGDEEDLDGEAREDLDRRLARLDARAADGAWTHGVLRCIRDRPGAPASELSGSTDLPTFKRRVRALKELGLTRSLAVGYALSPRGRAYLAGN